MLIREQDNCIEIVALERIPADLPTPGDTRFSIRVQSEGFTGEATAWVDWSTLKRFSGELADLDATRSGRAEMEGMSPDTFRLTIKTIDGWGHTAVCGRLANRKHAIEFEFEFQNDRLPELAREFSEFARPAK